jgi:hypothetical protein
MMNSSGHGTQANKPWPAARAVLPSPALPGPEPSPAIIGHDGDAAQIALIGMDAWLPNPVPRGRTYRRFNVRIIIMAGQ